MYYRCEERHAVRRAELKFHSDNGPLTVLFLRKKTTRYFISSECLTRYRLRLSAVQLKTIKTCNMKQQKTFVQGGRVSALYENWRNIVSCTSQCYLNIKNWCYLHSVDSRPLIYGCHENLEKFGPTRCIEKLRPNRCIENYDLVN